MLLTIRIRNFLKILIEIFWKTKTFFKKLEYCFSVESTTIENVFFSYKTVISKANVTTNRMVITKLTYHRTVFCQYPAGTHRPEDVPFWSCFGPYVWDHYRTNIGRIRFLTYLGCAMYDMPLESGNIEKIS